MASRALLATKIFFKRLLSVDKTGDLLMFCLDGACCSNLERMAASEGSRMARHTGSRGRKPKSRSKVSISRE